MGRFPVAEKRVEIGYLHPRHRSMARALVAEGLTPTQLAERYNLSRPQVSIIINSPLFRAEMTRLEALAELESINARKELEMLQGRSIEVLAEDLYAKDRRLRHQSAIDVLDRSGHPKGAPMQKHLHAHAHMHADVANMERRELYETVMDLVEEDQEEV